MRTSARCAAVAVTTAALAAATALAGVPAARAAQVTHAAPAWSPTHTRAVLLDGTHLGATPASQVLHLTLSLAPRHQAAMARAVKATYTPGIAAFHRYLTAAQWRSTYAPSPASVAAVTSYLARAGLTHVEVSPNRLEIAAEATAATAESAFRTSIESVRFHGATVYGNVTGAQVPAALSSTITAVMGLDDVPLDAVGPRTTRAAAGSPSTGGLFPSQFRTSYDATGTVTGRKTTVAILSEGATAPVISSLRYAEAQEKQPKVPVSVVAAGVQSPDTSGAGEFDMDTQTSSMMAGFVKRLYLYNVGGLTDAQLVYGFDRFIADDKAQAMSASIGGCEYAAYLDGSELSLDVAMQEAALQGQSLFASSGDEGDACAILANTGTPAGVPQDEWPAVGTYVTAVGGTSLVSDDHGNRIQELAWLGGGGGDSEFENPGFWTADTDPGYVSEYVSGGRAVPDVALDADPNVATPVKVYVDKTLSFIGGTSLSSPLMLGVWARLESAHDNHLGLASIALYDVYDRVNPGTTTSAAGIPVPVPAVDPKPVPGFHDIVLGSNGLYQARTGWDYTTGLGAPDVRALIKVIGHHLVTPGVRTYREVRPAGSGRQVLTVTARFTHTLADVAPTGSVTIRVRQGRSCTATVSDDTARCSVPVSTVPRHTVSLRYSGDSRYTAVARTFVTITKT